MRLILFFDLPILTKKDRYVYSVFRRYLIKQGYIMLQYSVYSKIFNNADAVDNHLKILKNNIPNDGSIRCLVVTEKQYSKMIILLGGKNINEEISTIESVIKL